MVFAWSMRRMFLCRHNTARCAFTSTAFFLNLSFLTTMFEIVTSHVSFFTVLTRSTIDLAISSGSLSNPSHLFQHEVRRDPDFALMTVLNNPSCNVLWHR